jgi:hydroxymethylglutaryl-CoA synthase
MSYDLKRKQQQLGIIDFQFYCPKYYVDQIELEEHDKASKGKYTIGLGQNRMSFVKDNEDINSICLTVLDKLLTRNKISPLKVGRLEVGTETFIDKSKSIKTHLMELFRSSGNFDIEGVTTSNACYGGTNALLNSLNWMHSDYYDGRYAIVICGDIAIYSKGNARPTGGCGSIAILLGPNACIEIERNRSTYMNNFYDFYKPDPTKEFPTVDGGLSIDIYFKALEYCTGKLFEKYQENENKGYNYTNTLNDFDYFCFHSPFSKMVEKAFYQLVSYDLTNNTLFLKDILYSINNKTENESLNINQNKNPNKNKKYLGVDLTKEKENKIFEKILDKMEKRKKDFKLEAELFKEISGLFKPVFQDIVEPSLKIGKNTGNIYTGSLFIGLISLILDENIDLYGKRVMMFSYGSGCAATLFSLKFNAKNLGDYKEIRKTNFDVMDNLLNKRIKVKPIEYENLQAKKERLYLSNNYIPENNEFLNDLFDGTYYLEGVDKMWRRTYAKKVNKEISLNGKINLSFNKLSFNDNDNDKLNIKDNANDKNIKNTLGRIMLIRNQLKSKQD